MRKYYRAAGFFLLFIVGNLTASAQVIEQPNADMTWEELVEHWESLSLEGKNETAVLFARAALEKARLDSTEQSLDYGNSLDYLGYSLHHTGQHAAAESYFLSAVEHARQHLGENHEDFITRLSNLAMLHLDMGELAKSASELEWTIHLSEKNLEVDNPYFAIMVNNLGLVYENMGDLDHALKNYLYALKLTENTVGKDHPRYATRLHNIAAVYRKTEKNQEALDYSLQALAIVEKNKGKAHPSYYLELNGVMQSYTSLNRYQEAMAISDELLVCYKNEQLLARQEAYDIAQGIAQLYYLTSHYERCLALSKETLEKDLQLFPRHYLRHNALACLAMGALEKLGRSAEAAVYAGLQLQFSLEELGEDFKHFSESEQLRLYKTYRQWSHNCALDYTVHHVEVLALNDAAYNYQMTIKGASMLNRRQLLQSLRDQPGVQLEAAFEEWKGLQTEISKQYALAPGRRKPTLDSLLTRANELERYLSLYSSTFKLASQVARWQDVQACLKPSEVAIEFERVPLSNDNLNKITDSVLYIAWLIHPGDQHPQQVFLFEEHTVGNLSATRRLYNPMPTEDGNTLRSLLWQPLEPYLKNITAIYFAPTGMLHMVNLGAVPISNTEVMADRFQLHRLVSTRQLIFDKDSLERIYPETALVYGGIRYEMDSMAMVISNASPSTESFYPGSNLFRAVGSEDEWNYLPSSMQEAIGIQQQLMVNGIDVNFADGFNASEGHFKKTVLHPPPPGLIHLATHGFFHANQDTNARSGFAAAEDPMARAGLVLAGANRVWSGNEPYAGQEDGILTALEISHLNLRGTQLAVLSACDTGKGEVAAGEGVLGLQRAFKMAGVQYVILSLWNVQDHQTQQFMDLFYSEWLVQKNSVPDAFRKAQMKMRSIYAKPFQPSAWAGFILLE